MLEYLIFYSCLVCSSFFASVSRRKDSFFLFCLPLFVAFIFLFAFRKFSVGTDTLIYIQNFNNNWNLYSNSIEPGYLLLSNVFHFCLKAYEFFFAFEAIVVVYCTYLLSKKDKSFFITFPLYYILLYIPGLNIQRQVFALSIALVLLFRKKNYSIQDLLLLSICCFIHKSICIFVLIYIFSKYFDFSNRSYKLMFFVFFLLIYFGIFEKLFFFLVDITPYRGYLDFFYKAGNEKKTYSVFNFLKWGLYFHLFDYTNCVTKKNLYNNFILVMFVADLLAKQYSFLFRLAFLFSPLIIPCMNLVWQKIDKEHKVKDKIFMVVILFFYTMQLYANLSLGQNDVIPFEFAGL